MVQKTDLNVSPYFDDYNEDDQFHKVLFKPAKAVQARELTQLQSILQNQIERFGRHIFQEGSIVIPGNVGFDKNYFAVKLQPKVGRSNLADNASTDPNLVWEVSTYLSTYKDTIITGADSGVTARVINYTVGDGTDADTLFVKYISAGTNNTTKVFTDGEQIKSDGTIFAANGASYGISAYSAILENSSATHTGCAVTVTAGVFFVRGMFVQTADQALIIEKYTNVPTCRVGFDVRETVETSLTNIALLDNAQGASNFSADGADRLKVELVLAKYSLTDATDTNFTELLRLDAGRIIHHVRYPEYSVVEDMIARRTSEESGDYVVSPFVIDIKEHLNNGINNGMYALEDVPAGDSSKFVAVISPGKAYVAGREVEILSARTVEFDKAREAETMVDGNVSTDMGQYANITNVYGVPDIHPDTSAGTNIKTFKTLQLFNRQTANRGQSNGEHIGYARVKTMEYSSGLVGSSSTNDTSVYKLYLFDINMFTNVTMSDNCSLTTGTLITGQTSGAIGMVISGTTNNTQFILENVVGRFSTGEAIMSSHSGDTIAGQTSIILNRSFSQDVKQIFQTFTAAAGQDFTADLSLDVEFTLSGNYAFGSVDEIGLEDGLGVLRLEGPIGAPTDLGDNVLGEEISNSIVGTNSHYDEEIVVGDIIGMPAGPGGAIETRRISFIGTGLDSNLATVNSSYTLDTTGAEAIRYRGEIKKPGSSLSIWKIPQRNIKSLYPIDTQVKVRRQYWVETTTGGVLTINAGTNETFLPFADKDYTLSIMLLGTSTTDIAQGDIVSADSGFTRTASNKTLTMTNTDWGTNTKIKVSVTLQLSDVNEAAKTVTKMETKVISENDASSSVYGLRVGDRQLSLGIADGYRCWSVFESDNIANAPVIPSLTISSYTGTFSDGEQILGSVSKATGLVVNDDAAGTLQFVYQTGTFTSLDSITGQTTKETANVVTTNAYSEDISEKYSFDGGQRDGYYDLARITRRGNESAPTGQIAIIFDYFTHSSGEYFSVDSYANQVEYDLLPTYSGESVGDQMDFRPMVGTPTSATISPFSHNNRDFEGIGSSLTHIPQPNSVIELDYQYYLGRADKLYINDKGQLIVSKGASAQQPAYSNKIIPKAMMLCGIHIWPYTRRTSDVKLTIPSNRRWTMKDITGLSKRIRSIERTVTLSLLEKEAENFRILDANGFDRFKTGFIVDSFKDHGVGNIYHEDYSGSVDKFKGEFRPEHDVQAVELIEENTTDTDRLDDHYVRRTDMVMLPYGDTKLANHGNPYASRLENLNPFNVIFWEGIVTLDPESDLWIDTDREPAFTVNVEGDYAQWLSWMGDKTTRIDWNSWQTDSIDLQLGMETDVTTTSDGGKVTGQRVDPTIVRDGTGALIGRQIFDIISTEITTEVSNTVSGTVSLEQSRTGTQFDLEEFRQTRSTGDETTMEIIPWMRQRDVEITVTGMKPNTQVYAFFNNKDVGNYVRPSGISLAETPLSTAIDKSATTVTVSNTAGFPNAPGALTISRAVDPVSPDRTFDPGDLASGSNDQYRWTDINGTMLVTSEKMVYSAKTGTTFTISQRGADNTTIRAHSQYTDSNGVLQWPTVSSGVRGMPLVTDSLGQLQCVFSIPNETGLRFPIGNGVFRLTDSDSNSKIVGTIDTAAEGVYHAFGQQQIKQERINSLRQGRVTRDDSLYETRNSTDNPNLTSSASATSSDSDTVSVEGERFHGWFDPIAQTIMIQEPQFPHGVFATKVEVFFGEKDTTAAPAPVRCELRTVVNGYPTDTAMPGSQITLEASEVNVSSDASLPTVFTFEWPQQLDADQEYCIVLISSSLDYKVWISRLGEIDIGGTSAISEQPYLGSLFKSQNASTWTASQYEDLKFQLYRATFDISKTGNLYMTNQPLGRSEGFVPKSDGTTRYLKKNPIVFDTAVINKAKVKMFGHGMYDNINNVIIKDVHSEISDTTLNEGTTLTAADTTITLTSSTNFPTTGWIKIDDEVITYSGVSGNDLTGCIRGLDGTTAATHSDDSVVQCYVLNGVPLTEINKTHTAITGMEVDSFDIPISLPPTRTMSAGGINALITKNVPYDTLYAKIRMIDNPATSVETYAQVTSGKTLGSPDSGAFYQTSFVRTPNASKFEFPLYENYNFTKPHIIASPINEANELAGKKSLRFSAELNSSRNEMSPVIDIGKGQSGVIAISNRINKVDNVGDVGALTANIFKDSSAPEGDNNTAIYMTKEINLKQPSTAIKVMFDASVQSEAGLKVYYRIKRSNSEQVFGDIGWVPFNDTGNPDEEVPISLSMNDFREYEFTAGNNDDVATTTLPLEDFSSFAVKVVLQSLNTAKPPLLRQFRALALAV
jgi:hypothetical protein